MNVKEHISTRLQEFIEICRANNVRNVYGFDSSFILNNTEESTVQILVDIDEPDPIARGTSLMDIWDSFEHYFMQQVILLTESSIKNPIVRESMRETKYLLFHRG